MTTPPQQQMKTPVSRIPIRTANAEKRARANDMLPPEYDESKLSPSEIRALRAQKRAAWRQARLKSLENDALQAQIMIQTMNAVTMHDGDQPNNINNNINNNPAVLHLKSDHHDYYPTIAEHVVSSSDEQVETMREKIIMLELEEPSSGSSERGAAPVPPQRSLDLDQDSTEAADVSLEEDHPDGGGAFEDDDDDDDEEEEEDEEAEEVNPLQTIVEVVNPALTGGNGQINDIIVGRYNDGFGGGESSRDDSFVSTVGGYGGSSGTNRFGYEEGRYESINDKMKNVLRELKQNEKVRLNLSKSMTEEERAEQEEEEEEDEEDDEDLEHYRQQMDYSLSEQYPSIVSASAHNDAFEGDDDDDDAAQQEDEEFRHYEEKTGAIGTVFMVRERLINDFYTHQSDLQQHQPQQVPVPVVQPPSQIPVPRAVDFYSGGGGDDGCEVIGNPTAFGVFDGDDDGASAEQLDRMVKLQKQTLQDEKLRAVFAAEGDDDDEDDDAGEGAVGKKSGEEKPSGIPVATGGAGSKRKKRKSKKKK